MAAKVPDGFRIFSATAVPGPGGGETAPEAKRVWAPEYELASVWTVIAYVAASIEGAVTTTRTTSVIASAVNDFLYKTLRVRGLPWLFNHARSSFPSGNLLWSDVENASDESLKTRAQLLPTLDGSLQRSNRPKTVSTTVSILVRERDRLGNESGSTRCSTRGSALEHNRSRGG